MQYIAERFEALGYTSWAYRIVNSSGAPAHACSLLFLRPAVWQAPFMHYDAAAECPQYVLTASACNWNECLLRYTSISNVS